MPLHPHIEKRSSPISGTGLFATALIKAGEVTWVDFEGIEESFFTYEQTLEWSPEEREYFWNCCYQVADNLYSCPRLGDKKYDDDGQYMNSSCNANTVYRGDTKMIAIRDIQPGEEVTYDYALSETFTSTHLPFKCNCSEKCRGFQTGFDVFMPKIAEQYGTDPITGEYENPFTSFATATKEKFAKVGATIPEDYLTIQTGPLYRFPPFEAAEMASSATPSAVKPS